MDAEEAVAKEADDDRRKGIREVVAYVAAIVGCGGLVVGVLEYIESRHQWSVLQTMDQIEYWDKGARTSYRELGLRVAQVLENIPDGDWAKAETDSAFEESLRQRLVERVLAQEGAQADFEEVMYFFSRLSLCIKGGVCDEHSAGVFFEDTVASFLDTFDGEIKRRAILTSGYGEAVLELPQTFSHSQ